MSESSLKVAVLAGGISHERDVSIKSGKRVMSALRAAGFHVEHREPDATLLEYLTSEKPDVVWPALHGVSGENGALSSLLDATGIPYVGSPSQAARLAWDKSSAKHLIGKAGITVARSVTLPHDTFRELGAVSVLRAVEDAIGLPLVVKPNSGGSSQGVTIVEELADLPGAMVAAYSYGETALIERFVPGSEVSVAIVEIAGEPVALPSVEIVPTSGTYDFGARYNAGETEFFIPARISDARASELADLALEVHRILGLRDLSRIDFIVGDDGPVFLEANTMPGLTETSTLPLAIEASGRTLSETYAEIARGASHR